MLKVVDAVGKLFREVIGVQLILSVLYDTYRVLGPEMLLPFAQNDNESALDT